MKLCPICKKRFEPPMCDCGFVNFNFKIKKTDWDALETRILRWKTKQKSLIDFLIRHSGGNLYFTKEDAIKERVKIEEDGELFDLHNLGEFREVQISSQRKKTINIGIRSIFSGKIKQLMDMEEKRYEYEGRFRNRNIYTYLMFRYCEITEDGKIFHRYSHVTNLTKNDTERTQKMGIGTARRAKRLEDSFVKVA